MQYHNIKKKTVKIPKRLDIFTVFKILVVYIEQIAMSQYILNPNTGRQLKIGSKRYKLLYSYGALSSIYKNPSSTPPNNNINSLEYKKWIVTIYNYYLCKSPEKLSDQPKKIRNIKLLPPPPITRN